MDGGCFGKVMGCTKFGRNLHLQALAGDRDVHGCYIKIEGGDCIRLGC